MQILVSAPSSHPAVRWVAHGLAGRGHDVEFFTSFAIPSDANLSSSVFLKPLIRELERRRLPPNLVKKVVRNVGAPEDLLRVILERGNHLKANLAVHNKMITKVQKAVMQRIEMSRPDFVIATGSMNATLAEYCFAKNIPMVVYLPQPVMGLVRKLDSDQADKMMLEETVKASELFAATHFLASSTFVSKSLRDAGLAQPIIRQPLGYPEMQSECRTRRWAGPTESGAFRMIFVGRASQQKGIPYLLEAVRKLVDAGRSVDLLAVSRDVEKLTKMVKIANLSSAVRVVPPMPRAELFAEFRNRDVFILPSIFEGYGLVVVEALSNSLPVIATPLTAAADLGVHNTTGFVINSKSSDEIVTAVSTLIDDPVLHSRFSKTARASTLDMDWESYSQKASQAVEDEMIIHIARD